MREAVIEAHLVERVGALGGTAYKFVSPGRVGVPDRIVIFDHRAPFFVELKAPGEVPTSTQQREHARLSRMGQRVYVCDSKTAVDRVLQMESVTGPVINR